MTITFDVIGTPAPQGSKSFKGTRRGKYGQTLPILAESSAKVKPWREAVKWQAPNADMIRGPVNLTITFVMPRPKSGKRRALPDRTPDLSKLLRSTEDAITEVRLWEDDARVVSATIRKVYEGPDAPLRAPGARITIEAAV